MRKKKAYYLGKVFAIGVFGVLILALLVAFSTETAYAADWAHKKQITINHDKVPSTQTNFPVLISITDADLLSDAQDDGDDICFTTIAGETNPDNCLSHEIEYFDGVTTGKLVAWVKIPSLNGDTDTEIYMHYGNGDCSSMQDATGVWDDNYVMVQHLQETSGPHYDSTTNDNDGTYYYNATYGNLQDVTGKMDGADGFYGYSGYYIIVANSASLDMGNTFTASLWVEYTDGTAPDNHERMLTRKSEYTDENGWEISLATGYDKDLVVRGSSDIGSPHAGDPSAGADDVVTSWAAGGWHHIVVVYDGSSASVYADGTYKDVVTIASVNDNDLPLYIGRYGGSDIHNWVGNLDEIRLSDNTRSAGWIETCYNNQSDQTVGEGHFIESVGNETDSSLPVELSYFTATAGDGQVTLHWVTESEIENLGFNIYRSQNHNDQLSIINDQLIPGAGSSSSRHEYEYVDKDVSNGITYWYKLEDVDYSGNTELHGPVSATPIAKATPSEFRLYPNYPNPFNPVTTISYDLPEDDYIELSIYNMRGEKVTTLLKGNQEAGSYRMNWDGKNRNGEIVSSGIYFLRIVSGSYCKTSKMVFIR